MNEPEKARTLKDIEVKLIAELMKNSRRSDRELAKTLKVSRPTVYRMIKRLEKEGYIKEYTIIPDFYKLGYEILAFSTYRLTENISPEEIEEKRKSLREEFKKNPLSYLLGMSGIGMSVDRMIVTYHKDYASFTEYLTRVKKDRHVKMGQVDTFIVSLGDSNHFSGLTLSALADHMMKMQDKE